MIVAYFFRVMKKIEGKAYQKYNCKTNVEAAVQFFKNWKKIERYIKEFSNSGIIVF